MVEEVPEKLASRICHQTRERWIGPEPIAQVGLSVKGRLSWYSQRSNMIRELFFEVFDRVSIFTNGLSDRESHPLKIPHGLTLSRTEQG
jgi:hypothetical protein